MRNTTKKSIRFIFSNLIDGKYDLYSKMLLNVEKKRVDKNQKKYNNLIFQRPKKEVPTFLLVAKLLYKR